MTRPHLVTADGGADLTRDPRPSDGATRLAERALLDALRAQPDHIPDVAGWLTGTDFADPHHGGIYTTLVGLHAAGELSLEPALAVPPSGKSGPISAATLHNELALRNALLEHRYTDVGYADHRQVLADISDAGSVRTAGQHARYGRMILESSVRRQLGEWSVRLNHTTGEPLAAPSGADRALAEIEGRLARSRGEFPAPVSTTLGTALPASAVAAVQSAPPPKLVHRAERQIIATVLDPHLPSHDLTEQLTPDDFTADPAHAETWRAIQAVSRRGEPVDTMTVAWELGKVSADTAPADLAVESLIALAPLSQRDPSRALTTVSRASLAHRALLAVQSVQDLARDRSQELAAVLAEARRITGDLGEQAARLTTTSAEDPRSTINRVLDEADQPAVRSTPPATDQPGRSR